MEKYNDILKSLKSLFPNSTDIRIEIDTNEEDLKDFSSLIKEFSKTAFYIQTGLPEPDVYNSLRTPFGMIKLKTK